MVAQEIFRVIENLSKERKTTVLLVEQNARAALKLANRGYVMETGRMILEGTAAELLDNKDVQRAYLGKDKKEIAQIATIAANPASPMNTHLQVAPSSRAAPTTSGATTTPRAKYAPMFSMAFSTPFLTCAATHTPEMALGMTPAMPVTSLSIS